MSDKTTVAWHLMIFDQRTNRLVTNVELKADQIAALMPYLGIVNEGGDESHFGMYPIKGMLWFAEEYMP